MKNYKPQKYELTSQWESTRVLYFDNIDVLDVTRTDQVEELEREEFTVVVNMLQKLPLQFDWEEFYLDVEDAESNQKQLDKIIELTEDLDDKNPEDKEKIKEIMDEHYIQYIERQRVRIECDCEDVVDMVNKFIDKNNV